MKKLFAVLGLALTTSCNHPYEPTDNSASLYSMQNHVKKRHMGPSVPVSVTVSSDSTLWHIKGNKEEIVTLDFDPEHVKQAHEANQNVFRVTVMTPINLPAGQTQPAEQLLQMQFMDQRNGIATLSKRDNAPLDLMMIFINGGAADLIYKSEKGLLQFVKKDAEAVVTVQPAPFVL